MKRGIKNLLVLNVFGLLFGMLIIGLVSAACPPEMISYWKLEGNALDSVGNNHGTVYGATTTTGQIGDALDFDDDYVEIDDNVNLDGMPAITLEAWVKWNGGADTNYDHIIAKHDGGGGGADSYFLAITQNDKLVFAIKDIIWLASSITVTTGEWHHLAGTYDGSDAWIYIDDEELVDTDSGTGNVPLPAAGMSLLQRQRRPAP